MRRNVVVLGTVSLMSKSERFQTVAHLESRLRFVPTPDVVLPAYGHERVYYRLCGGLPSAGRNPEFLIPLAFLEQPSG